MRWGGGGEQRIQLPPVGLNIHTQKAYIRNEKHVRNKWEAERNRRLKKVKKKVIVFIVKKVVMGVWQLDAFLF